MFSFAARIPMGGGKFNKLSMHKGRLYTSFQSTHMCY